MLTFWLRNMLMVSKIGSDHLCRLPSPNDGTSHSRPEPSTTWSLSQTSTLVQILNLKSTSPRGVNELGVRGIIRGMCFQENEKENLGVSRESKKMTN